MHTDDNKELIAQVVSVLEDMHVPYMIGGSVALSVWAAPRMTHDIDIVVDLPEHLIADFCNRFSAEHYNIDADMMRTTFRLKDHPGMGMYSFIDSEVGLKVDLFPLRHNDPAQQFALSRRVLEEIAEGVKAYVYTAEDLLLQKLRWYAQSESQRQFRDCMNLLLSDQNRAVPLISLDHIENWANRLGVDVQTAWAQLLAATRQSGSPPAD